MPYHTMILNHKLSEDRKQISPVYLVYIIALGHIVSSDICGMELN